MIRTSILTALTSTLALAAACNPLVVTPIVTGGAGGSQTTTTSAATSPSGEVTAVGTSTTSSTGGSSTGGGSTGSCSTGGSISGGARVLANAGPAGVVAMAAGGGFVYWSGGDALWRVAADGGCPEQVMKGGIGGGGWSTLIADGTNLYWSLDPGTGNVNDFYEMPLSGGTPTLLATSDWPSAPIAVGATNVYFARSQTQANPVMLMQVPIAGGTPTPVVTTGAQPQVHALAADANNVYWWDVTGDVDSMPVAGGQVRTIATGQSDLRAFVASQGWVYLLGATGLLQVPGAGGPMTVFMGTNMHAIAVDAHFVYVADDDGKGHGYVKEVPLGGTEPTLAFSLDMGDNCPSQIAVDETNVYWSCVTGTSDNLVWSAPKGF